MSSTSASQAATYSPRAASRSGPFADHDLILTNLWVAIIAFGLAACMAVMQALSRASLEVPYRSPRMYYMSVTAHGILMALVFTTFFIMALGDVVVDTEIGELPSRALAQVSYAVAIIGTVLTIATVFTFNGSVLFTFYPPMQAKPAFYIGLTLLVVGSWGWCVNVILAWAKARKARADRPVSLAMHAMAVTAMLWLLATIGVACEMLFQLIPWSLGLEARIDPLLARTLFWFFGHPLVYFWVLPAYMIWYTVLPREAGGKLFSEPLGRMVFTLFLDHLDTGGFASPIPGPRHRLGMEVVPYLQHDADLVPQPCDGIYHLRIARSRRTTAWRHRPFRLDPGAAVGEPHGCRRSSVRCCCFSSEGSAAR